MYGAADGAAPSACSTHGVRDVWNRRPHAPQDLADAVGGVVGCSKPLVDAGWLDKEQLVGFSGHTVKPRLYLAVGVSGSSQHLIGMRAADTIVAINSDPAAPIFEISDYAIVGDLYEVVPRLTAAVRRMREADQQPVCS
jgi:electron transfer flavoprotein alpha subunit